MPLCYVHLFSTVRLGLRPPRELLLVTRHPPRPKFPTESVGRSPRGSLGSCRFGEKLPLPGQRGTSSIEKHGHSSLLRRVPPCPSPASFTPRHVAAADPHEGAFEGQDDPVDAHPRRRHRQSVSSFFLRDRAQAARATAPSGSCTRCRPCSTACHSRSTWTTLTTP
jgi:hypothetical protein